MPVPMTGTGRVHLGLDITMRGKTMADNVYTRAHYHAYVGNGDSVNYRACCVESWMGAITALRQMGYSGRGTSVPDVPAEQWQSPTRRGDNYPRAVIQSESGDYDTCNPGEGNDA